MFTYLLTYLPPPPTARQVSRQLTRQRGPTCDLRRDDPPMRSCHLALALIGTTLHGAQALDRRPAIAIRPSSRSHDILRGGAGNKHPAVTPLVQGPVKTIRRCIMASNVISFLILAVAFISVTRGHHASLMHEVGGFQANPLLQALEDQFKQHCRPDSYWISDHPSLVGCQHAQIKLVVWSNTLLGWPFNTVLPMPRPFGMYALLARGFKHREGLQLRRSAPAARLAPSRVLSRVRGDEPDATVPAGFGSIGYDKRIDNRSPLAGGRAILDLVGVPSLLANELANGLNCRACRGLSFSATRHTTLQRMTGLLVVISRD